MQIDFRVAAPKCYSVAFVPTKVHFDFRDSCTSYVSDATLARGLQTALVQHQGQRRM